MSIIKKEQLYPSYKIQRTLPLTLSKADREFYAGLCNSVVQPISYFELGNVSLLASGNVFSGLKEYEEVQLRNDTSSIGHLNWKGLLRILLSYKKKRLRGDVNYLLIHNPYSHTYYHWLLEALPRLFLLKDKIGDATLLLPKNHQLGFHLGALKIFGVNEPLYLEDKTYYSIQHLITVSQIGRVANYHGDVLRACANYIKENTPKTRFIGDRFYISRRKALKRKILNEPDVLQVLNEYAIKEVIFEDLTFADQVALASRAKVLVGIHGAGLSNMIFMKPASKIIELRKNDKGENYFFYSLANLMNHEYYYQYCESPESDVSVQEANLIVDINKFRQNLAKIFSNES